MLLLAGVFAFASCNSYDVEGKPEIASNPAKKVFAYYPWDDGSAAEQEPAETETDDADTAETDDADANGEPAETDDADIAETEPDEQQVEPDDNTTVDDNDNETTEGDDISNDQDPTGEGEGEASIGENNIVVKKATTVDDVIQEEFKIYNRGVTGELKIRKINLIDPNGQVINELENETYKKLFQIEIQQMKDGRAQKDENGFLYGSKVLTFDNMSKENEADHIAALCPLKDDTHCKAESDDAKLNTYFMIRLSYSKEAATALKDNPSEEKITLEGKDEEVLKYRQYGEFAIEICTNDPTKGTSKTCGNSSTSYRISVKRQPNKPPKPIIHVAFDNPIAQPLSYRNIYDQVEMNLKETCVSDPEAGEKCFENCIEEGSDKNCLNKCCLKKEEWEQNYYIKYKWEMKETPTPLLEESKLGLMDMDAQAGQWLSDNGNQSPKRASFKGLMITPRRLEDKNASFNDKKCGECGTEPAFDKDNPDKFYFLKLSNYLICHQKYCEENRTKYYKINIQAETVDKATDLVSDTADITIIPKIIPQARVVTQLTWKQGFKTKAEVSSSKEDARIDMDIHLVKKTSIEAANNDSMQIKDGLLGTKQRTNDNKSEAEEYFRHDDCSFGDQGKQTDKISATDATIQWHASLDFDNTWGGGNYDNPETIGLGPIEDKDGDGVPDVPVEDDQYLVVVGYVDCESKYKDGAGDRCSEDYKGTDSVYEIDARVEILIDGDEAGKRKVADDRPADSYDTVVKEAVKDENGKEKEPAITTKNFKIKYHEWKVVAVVKWDNKWKGPESNPSYKGNAVVTDTAMREEGIVTDPISHPVCTYDNSDAVLVPIWDAPTYKAFVEEEREDRNGNSIGHCGPLSNNGGNNEDPAGENNGNEEEDPTGENNGNEEEDPTNEEGGN